MQAHIFRRHQQTALTNPLQIKKQNIGFFIDPIKETSRFVASDNGQDWQLRFFIGSAFEQELIVCLNGDNTPNKNRLGRACWLDNRGVELNDAGLLRAASQFLRQSDTLPLSQKKELTSHRSLLPDRDGVAYFSDDCDQFKRILLCQSLAIAYTRVLTECMAQMTKVVQNNHIDEALGLYEKILRFNAAHYFGLPILLERHELFAAWKVICKHYHLNELNEELTKQLSDVAALLREQREHQRALDDKAQRDAAELQRDAITLAAQQQSRRDNEKDRRRTFLISIVGVLLTAASLLSLLQLTPTQFQDNVSAWNRQLFKANQNVDSQAQAGGGSVSTRER